MSKNTSACSFAEVGLTDKASLIVGGESLLGAAVASYLGKAGCSVARTTRRRACSSGLFLDLEHDPGTWELPVGGESAFLFAAMTSLRECEDNPEKARRINVEHTVRLAEMLLERGYSVLFPSTNLVFSDASSFPVPKARTNPATTYGSLKAEAEKRLLTLGGRVYVVRYSKILQAGYALFTTWARELASGNVIRPFNDYRLSPISLEYAAMVSVELVARCEPGIWHVSAKEDMAYSDAAFHVAATLGAAPALVRAVSSVDSGAFSQSFSAPAALDASKTEKALGLAVPDVWEVVRQAAEVDNA